MAKAEGVTAELQDMRLKGEPVQEPGGQPFVPQYLNPVAEGEIGGNDERDPFMQSGTELEEELCASRGEGYIAKLIQNDELVAQGLVQELGQLMLLLCSLKFVDQQQGPIRSRRGSSPGRDCRP
jgi:hypothetical protein